MEQQPDQDRSNAERKSPKSNFTHSKPLTALYDSQKWHVRSCLRERIPRSTMRFRLFGIENRAAGKTQESNVAESEHTCDIPCNDHMGYCENPDAPEEGIAGYPQDPSNDLRTIEQPRRSHDDRVRRRKP